MTITMKLTLLADNEIQFYDACKHAADVLEALADKALADGDHEQFRNTTHDVIAPDYDDELIGVIKVSR